MEWGEIWCLLAVFSPKPCSTNSASIMQGAQNGDQMMFGIFVGASAFVFVLGVSSWVRQKFLPTGELGTFFRLAVFLGIFALPGIFPLGFMKWKRTDISSYLWNLGDPSYHCQKLFILQQLKRSSLLLNLATAKMTMIKVPLATCSLGSKAPLNLHKFVFIAFGLSLIAFLTTSMFTFRRIQARYFFAVQLVWPSPLRIKHVELFSTCWSLSRVGTTTRSQGKRKFTVASWTFLPKSIS